MPENVVEVSGLTRHFGTTRALDALDFRAEQGLIYGLVGVNGAGKTTLIRHLLGLLRAKSGTVRVFGMDPVRRPVEVLGRIGYLSEERDLPEWMTIEELMRYTQAYYPAWDAVYANELLETFGLTRANRIKDLSKGMRAQVGLVAAVAHRPELLVLDEPSSGLDAVVREDILSAIVRTVTDDGRTVLFSSHLLDEVERMSDHVTMVHEGRVIIDGALDTVREAHRVSSVRFAKPLERLPRLAGVFKAEGAGRNWSLVHEHSAEQLQSALAQCGGELLQSRGASLQEIFVSRVKRKQDAA